MPSWPSRLLHASQPPGVPEPPASDHSHSVKNEVDDRVFVSVSPSDRIQPRQTSSQSPRHGRSLSHPLASLLGHSQKNDSRYRDGTKVGGQNDSIHQSRLNTNRESGCHGPSNALTPKARDVELVSGRCATCDSTVKWPKHLSVFRCTICLMVNDLEPMEKRPQVGGMYGQNNEKGTPPYQCA